MQEVMGNARSAITAALLQSLQWCAADILPRTFLINMLVICIAVHPADVKGSCHIVAGRVSKRAEVQFVQLDLSRFEVPQAGMNRRRMSRSQRMAFVRV